MEGIEATVFFTFFGLDAIIDKRMDSISVATVGNSAMRMPGGLKMPTLTWGNSWNVCICYSHDEKRNGEN